MQMDVQARFGSIASHSCSKSNKLHSSSSSCFPLGPLCTRKDPQQPEQNGDNSKGEKFSTDWDKAWSSFRKQGKKSLSSLFNPNKYVSWNPTRSNHPLSEEVDPIKRTERSNLMLWTTPRFTLAGAIIVVTFLLLYTILAPVNCSLSSECSQSGAMADPHKKKKVSLPPRRGLIKVKILSNIVKLVARAAAKARRRLEKKEEKVISEETQLPQPHDSNSFITKS